jgi:hypothetical protein
MELIAAIVLAGPLGYFARRGLLYYLLVWTIVFPVQIAVVWSDATGDDGPWAYFAVNAAILALGIGLNRLGRRLKVRRGKVQGGLVMPAPERGATIES